LVSGPRNQVLANYSKPVLDAAQDGPHNQIESNTAIEGAVLVSGGRFQRLKSANEEADAARHNPHEL
jgi:hypothetical protein